MLPRRFSLTRPACALAFVFSALSTAQADTYNFGYSSSWLNQIGVTQAILNNANGGSGFTIGIVDTGINSSLVNFAGRISSASSCGAATFACYGTTTDTIGHGTAVAAVAAGSNATNAAYMMGVAPKATIVVEKVADAGRSTYDVDLAKGITKAADAGAKVINVSFTYGGTTAITNAINYAASKGAVIVWAGGNSSTVFGGNTIGLTAEAQKRFIIAGAVDANNKLASFSNTPGTAYGATVNGKFVQYQNFWIMAPGVNLIAPYGSGLYYISGTSFSAPIVSGAIALLETTWPILYKNGTVTQLLFATAKDLGAAGKDATYGNGLIDMSKAWQPQGTLTVKNAKGADVAVTSLTTSMITGGALGSLSAIKARLANTTSFDSYTRNYSVNLSGLIATKPTTGTAAAATATAPTVTSFKAFNGASVTQYTASESLIQKSTLAPQFDAQPTPAYSAMTLVSPDGHSVLSAGHGFSASLGFNEALHGHYAGDASNALMGLTDGGKYFAFGSRVSDETRFAVLYAGQTPINENWTAYKASTLGFGMTRQLSKEWSAGFSLAMLDEQQSLLGSSYDRNSLLDLGAKHKSNSLSMHSEYALNQQSSIKASYTHATTQGGSASGLISNVSNLNARAYSLSFVQRKLAFDNDALTLTYRKPLRLISGSATLMVSGVAEDGTPTQSSQRISLRPDGNETDWVAGYTAPTGKTSYLSANLTHSTDVNNIAGEKATTATLNWSKRF